MFPEGTPGLALDTLARAALLPSPYNPAIVLLSNS